MPSVSFDELPRDARVWVFASDRPLTKPEVGALLAEVDRFLAGWKAHGSPLRSAREWRDDRFLAIGVDPTAEQASGCSIDGLFRGLRNLETALDTRLMVGGRVFYRDETGETRCADRRDVRVLAASGRVTDRTCVFDTSVTSARDWRDRFEVPASDSWVASLLPSQSSQESSRAATNSSSAKKG